MELLIDKSELLGGTMKTQLTLQDENIIQQKLPLVVEKLDSLKARVEELQKTLPRGAVAARPTLESARRDALKTKLELDGLEDQYNDILGLDMVEGKMHEQLREVGEVRKLIGTQYVECESLLDIIKPALKAMRGKVAEPLLENLEALHTEIKETLKEIQAMGYQTPELGMTFAEWNSLSLAQRRGLRSPGRPSAPLEAQIIKTHRNLLDIVALVNFLSKGKIRTVEDAIDGVEMSKRGRPQVSDLGKADRKLVNLQKRLESVSNTASKMRDKKVARLLAQINELTQEIAEEEAELTEVEAAKRELETLRGKHRDMVVAEVDATGENQAALLMAIIRNEDAQLTTVEKILKLDPEARVTVTHKVNPKETRMRFERLRMNGQIKAAEMEELTRLEHRQDNFAYSRNR